MRKSVRVRVRVRALCVCACVCVQMTVTVGQQQHWSIQKRWSQFVELDGHLRDAFQV